MANPQPGQVPVYWTRQERPDKFEILDKYCDRDVEVQALLNEKLRPLSPAEHDVMLVDMEINDRGVCIDMESVHGALKIIETGKRRLNREIAALTKHFVTKVTETARLLEWLTTNGLAIDNLQKETLARVLADPSTDPLIRRVVQLRAWGSKSSVGKLEAMLHYASVDGRARGLHVFLGAASTGRFSGAGIQTQNMVRPSGLVDHTKTPEVFDDIRLGDYDLIELKWGPPFQVIADCLRGFLCAAPGKVLYIADFAQIEARIIAMLAGQKDVVDVFVTGGDVYKVTASKILGVPIAEITKDQRQLGKVVVLACLTADTEVLTRSGLRRIVDVRPGDEVWDGVQWVATDGVVARGHQRVIRWQGIGVTPDHLVLTPNGWATAFQVASGSTRFQKSVLDLAGSLLPDTSLAREAASSSSLSSATAGLSHTEYRTTPLFPARVRSVIAALRKALVGGSRTTGRMRTSYPTTPIAGGCSTGYLRSFSDVTTRAAPVLSTTAGAASAYTAGGVSIEGSSSNISSPWMGGITQILSWIEQTIQGITNPVTFGLFRDQRTCTTEGGSSTCKDESMRLSGNSPVFDLLNCGPRNRFTVKTETGYAIVHNCGFGMGPGKFQDTAEGYGVFLTADEAETYVKAYRESNPRIKRYWYRLEEAAVSATANPGAVYKVGDVAYKRVGRFLNCRLPSGRILVYPYPRLEDVETPWGQVKQQLSYLGIDNVTKMPRRISAYGGLLAENITQAVASDCLRSALLRLSKAKLPVVLHIHDEVVVEHEEDPAVQAKMSEILTELPDFAKSLGWPDGLIAAEVDPPCLRYKK